MHWYRCGRRRLLGAAAALFLSPIIAGAALAEGRSFKIFFDKERTDITTPAKKLIAIIKESIGPSSRVTIVGHADASESGPDRLSLARAAAVQKVLIGFGIPRGASISIVGKGATEPWVPTGPGVADPQNRRAEVVVE